MIEGIKVTIKGAELQSLCRAQVSRLNDRAEKLEKQIPVLDEVASAAPSKSGPSAAEDAREKVEKYRNNAAELVFIADHIDPVEDFLLGNNDLARIGITKGGYW